MNKATARFVRKTAKKNAKRLKAIPTRGKLLFMVAMAPKRGSNNLIVSHPLKPIPMRHRILRKLKKITGRK